MQKPVLIGWDVAEAAIRCSIKSWIWVNEVEQSMEGIAMSTSQDRS